MYVDLPHSIFHDDVRDDDDGVDDDRAGLSICTVSFNTVAPRVGKATVKLQKLSKLIGHGKIKHLCLSMSSLRTKGTRFRRTVLLPLHLSFVSGLTSAASLGFSLMVNLCANKEDDGTSDHLIALRPMI